jgi:predicted phosphodiesterase
MKYAIFSDVHSNLPALQAVLSDIEQQGVGEIFHCGDLVGYGPYPNEVVNLIRESQASWATTTTAWDLREMTVGVPI